MTIYDPKTGAMYSPLRPEDILFEDILTDAAVTKAYVDNIIFSGGANSNGTPIFRSLFLDEDSWRQEHLADYLRKSKNMADKKEHLRNAYEIMKEKIEDFEMLVKLSKPDPGMEEE